MHNIWCLSETLAWYHSSSKALACLPISCILALFMGGLCHFSFYHDLTWLTIYDTTAKRPICISRHRYIINNAVSANDWGDGRLFEVKKDRSSASTYCRGQIAFFGKAQFANCMTCHVITKTAIVYQHNVHAHVMFLPLRTMLQILKTVPMDGTSELVMNFSIPLTLVLPLLSASWTVQNAAMAYAAMSCKTILQTVDVSLQCLNLVVKIWLCLWQPGT